MIEVYDTTNGDLVHLILEQMLSEQKQTGANSSLGSSLVWDTITNRPSIRAYRGREVEDGNNS